MYMCIYMYVLVLARESKGKFHFLWFGSNADLYNRAQDTLSMQSISLSMLKLL